MAQALEKVKQNVLPDTFSYIWKGFTKYEWSTMEWNLKKKLWLE